MTKKMYYAAVEGFLFDKYRKIGEPVGMLSVDEAKYPAQMGQISETAPGQPTTVSGGGVNMEAGGGKGGKAGGGEA
ncbi:hypothetical protein [Shinella sp. JR1-6]|uniref:hypothetical protein n=1 Tax=Shinella sp. JR1-6 TaxID=2527671 RepID=UPI00102D5385|nr:hypothetical protein [Shinella sp. JR1-6]TAA54633.1 hypothetical protein EXZ48_26775 [Shinella sp. JR1-6]